MRIWDTWRDAEGNDLRSITLPGKYLLVQGEGRDFLAENADTALFVHAEVDNGGPVTADIGAFLRAWPERGDRDVAVGTPFTVAGTGAATGSAPELFSPTGSFGIELSGTFTSLNARVVQ